MPGSMLIVPMSGARMIVVAAHDAMARLYHWTSLRVVGNSNPNTFDQEERPVSHLA
jgi:hypothetical protein